VRHQIKKLTKRDGDTVVAEWTPGVVEEEEKAKDVFNSLAGGGFMVFNAPVGAPPEGPVRTFDPAVQTYIVAPRFKGG
jgi:hypothetical protein